MRPAFVAALFFTVSAAACAEPRVDASTEESFRASLERVRGSVAPHRRGEFDEAVLAISASRVVPDAAGRSGAATEAIREAFGGKTAEDIFAGAAELEERRAAGLRTEIEQEIAQLVTRQQSASAARHELERFEVLDVLLAAPSRSPRLRFHVQVRNRTGYSVYGARVDVVAFESASQPDARGVFEVRIDGGLEPGQSGTWTLEADATHPLNGLGPTYRGKLRAAVTRIDDEDGAVILDGDSYTEADAARLIALQMELASLDDGR